jgi:hypothetical protein
MAVALALALWHGIGARKNTVRVAGRIAALRFTTSA